ncbi:hypothetical protein TFLX_05092 [Thermoflexales bacterium]|nr:hypothetical protein TFLX_05092 [Thermoflexales bacterium]
MSLSLSLDALLFGLLAAAYLGLRFALPDFPQLVPDDLRAGALVTLMVGGYWLLDLLPRRSPLMQQIIQVGKYLAVAVTVIIVVVLPTILAINQRHQTAPHQFAHDGLMQSESATQFALAGRNPYIESYQNTPMGQWQFNIGGVRINPALEHYAYMPLTFLLPLPAQGLAQQIWGWFDQRWVYLVFFAALLVLCLRLTSDAGRQISLVVILALNPLFVPFLIEGRNDVLSLFGLILTLLALQRQRWVPAAVTLALSCATKQYAWFLVPFFCVFVAGHGTWSAQWARLKRPVIAFSLTAAVAILPWALWNPTAFLGDILYFQSSPMGGGYPISGFSIGVLLLAVGVLPSPLTPFPYWLLQLAFSLPVLWIMLRRVRLHQNVPEMLIGFGLVLFTIAFFSPFFHDNYFGYIIAVMALAWVLTGNQLAQEVRAS